MPQKEDTFHVTNNWYPNKKRDTYNKRKNFKYTKILSTIMMIINSC